VKGQAHGLLLAVIDRLARRLVGLNGHQRDLARRRLDHVRIQEGQIHLLDHVENRLGLERRTVQPVLNLVEELGLQRLGPQPVERFLLPIA
jgi:hypothetical protein